MATVKVPKPVLVIYVPKDEFLAKKYVVPVLQNKCSVPCLLEDRDFTVATETEEYIQLVTEAIRQCSKTVLVLTSKSVKGAGTWIKHKTLKAIEIAQETRHLGLIVVFISESSNDDPLHMCGLLSKATLVKLDFNRKTWHRALCLKIHEIPSEDERLVTRNLAIGQAWSHFTGYSKSVLPALSDSIRNSPWYKCGKFPLVLFELFPESGRTGMKLENIDTRIKCVGHLEDITVDRGTYTNRPYSLLVYCITDEKGEKWYFTAQVANSLGLLYKLEKEFDKWLLPDSTGKTPPLITEGEKRLQRDRFFFTMNRLVNHPFNKTCNGKSRLICYDDDTERLGDVMLTAIKTEVLGHQKGQEEIYRSANQVCILGGNREDRHAVKEELSAFIFSHGYNMWSGEGCLCVDDCEILRQAIKAKIPWLVFILTRESLEQTDFPLLHWDCRSMLQSNIGAGLCRVIAVLHDLTESELTYDLGWVTAVSTGVPDYGNEVVQAIKCGTLSLEQPLKTTDVSVGLAWAYVINYLCIILDKQVQVMKDYVYASRRQKSIVFEKLLILIPSSCCMDPVLTGQEKDGRFQLLHKKTFQHSQSPGQNREYQVGIYSLTTAYEEYVMAAEFPNPILCLKEMSCMPRVSDLVPNKLHNEAWRFKEIAEQVLKKSIVADKATFLYYDDSRRSIADVLLNCMEYEEDL